MRTILIIAVATALCANFIRDINKMTTRRKFNWLLLLDVFFDLFVVFGFIILMGGLV